MDTSKTSSIKLLLLEAWKERWSDVQWGIHIKRVLPRGVSGDVYDLADCILQQALVGSGPNHLFLSYLTHCLNSHIVSYGAVLLSISHCQSFYKPYCILSMLDLLKNIQPRVSCRGNDEECITLCKAMVSISHWLYSCMQHSLTKLAELKHSPEHVSIMEKSCDALKYICNSTFMKALLYVGKYEDQGMYNQLLYKHQELETKVGQIQNFVISKDVIETGLGLIKAVDNLSCIASQNMYSSLPKKQLLLCSLNAMIAIDAILNPASDIQSCVDQLLLLQTLQNLTLPELYCRIIQACFMGLVDAAGSSEDLKWAAFTFLKVPHLILQIHNTQWGTNPQPNNKGSVELEQGIEKLLYFTPLLDLTDTKSNCDCLQYLLTELCKVKLITPPQVEKILHHRQSESQRQNLPRSEQQTTQAGANLILRAEPTVISILKSLDSDYSKIQDALLGVLCHMVPGKNFELILSAAAATGKLHDFATKLIKFNEYNKHSREENAKASLTRALLFDITFLMLSHIVQHYGSEIVTMSAETKDSFFATWISECWVEGGKYKCPDMMLSKCDPNKVDNLLSHFTSSDSDFKTNLMKWHEVCINAPMAIKEILIAWEYGALSTDNVKMILDNVKSRMCCLPVCISTWLCNYINVLHHEERLKPMNMLQQFMTPLSVDSGTTAEGLTGTSGTSSGRQTPQQTSQDQSNIFYKERSTLMAGMIKKMMYDLHPPTQTKAKGMPVIPHGLTSRTPMWDIVDGIFWTAHSHGWLDLKAIHNLDTLLCVGGGQWFCDTLVRFALRFEHLDDLHRAIDLVFGLFHLDIEECALALLIHVLPSYLHNEVRQEMLAEPRGSALARLVVMTTYAALQVRQSASYASRKYVRKHSYRDMEVEEIEIDRGRPSKMRRLVNDAELLEDTPYGLQSSGEEHLRNVISDPIKKAIADIMRMLMMIAADATISQKSVFPLVFLEQVILCAKEQAYVILQFMPLSLVPQLIKTSPEHLSHELVLAVSSMLTPRSRKVVARTLCQLDVMQQRETA